MEFMDVKDFCSRGTTWQEGQNKNEASYIMIGEETLHRLKKQSDDYEDEYEDEDEDESYFDLNDVIYSMPEEIVLGNYYTKLHIALCFLLTEILTDPPVENKEHIYTAVLDGGEPLDEDEGVVCFIENAELPDIIKALENIDIKELEKNFNPKIFRLKRIYPVCIWDENKKEALFKALIDTYNELLDFYRKAKEENASVLKSLYGQRLCLSSMDLLRELHDTDDYTDSSLESMSRKELLIATGILQKIAVDLNLASMKILTPINSYEEMPSEELLTTAKNLLHIVDEEYKRCW